MKNLKLGDVKVTSGGRVRGQTEARTLEKERRKCYLQYCDSCSFKGTRQLRNKSWTRA